MSEGSLFTDCHCMIGIECYACKTGHTDESLNMALVRLGLHKRKANAFGQFDIMRGEEVWLAAATAGEVWRWLGDEQVSPGASSAVRQLPAIPECVQSVRATRHHVSTPGHSSPRRRSRDADWNVGKRRKDRKK